MALNINFENKKQLILIIVAIAVGLVASLLMTQVVEKNMDRRSAEIASSFQKKQKVFEQQISADRQRVAALNNEIARIRNEQAKAIETMRQMSIQQQQKKEVKEEEKPQPSLAIRTPQGKRATTIQIESLAAVGGLVNPGDFVDVLAHLKVPVEAPERSSMFEEIENEPQFENVTAMVFQNIQVLAVNSSLEKGDYAKQQSSHSLKVTFALDPQEVGLLAFAQKHGKLELSLRSPREKNQYITEAADWDTLSEYIEDRYGTSILPKKQAKKIDEPTLEDEIEEEVIEEPYIEVFRKGQQI